VQAWPSSTGPEPASSLELEAVEALVRFVGERRLCVLSGAGISTESGIPDYRGPETRRRARQPMRAREFLATPAARARYWARSFVGWPRIHAARPNPAHRALVGLERLGRLQSLLTQNVDGLHEAAGQRAVTALHGRLSEVVCLDCGALSSRVRLQARLTALNPDHAGGEGSADAAPQAPPQAPDGDADLDPAAGFRVADCEACGGVLKPHVVFFGETVPRARVEAGLAAVEAAEALLVVGSSLTVFSGFRFVRRAAELGRPIAILNLGETRGDPLAAIKLDARAGAVLPRVVERLRLAEYG
jgi:NAD-dependent deacetylase sirtuin 4